MGEVHLEFLKSRLCFSFPQFPVIPHSPLNSTKCYLASFSWVASFSHLAESRRLSQRIEKGSSKAVKEHANQLVALCSMAGLIPGLQLLILTESRLRMKGCTFSVQTSFVIRQKSIQQSISSKPALPPLHNLLHYSDHLYDSFTVSEKGFFSAGEVRRQNHFKAPICCWKEWYFCFLSV